VASVTLLPNQDVYISEWYANENFNSSEGLFVSQYQQPGDDYRSLFQFNLASIPPTCTIEKAELEIKIYRNEVNGGILIEAHRLLNNWLQNQVTWNNCPPFSPDTDGEACVSQGSPPEFLCIDITNLVRGWYDGSIPNNGLILIGNEAENDLVGFVSTRSTYSNKWPKLRINFTVGVLNHFPSQELHVPEQDSPFIESNVIPLGPRERATFLVCNLSDSKHVRAIVQVGYSYDPNKLFFNVGEWKCLEPSGFSGEAVALSTTEAAEFARVLIEGRGGEEVIVYPRTKEL